MPLDTSIAYGRYGGRGGGGGGGDDFDPFQMIGSVMQMRGQQELLRERSLMNQKRLNDLQDDDAIDETLKKHAALSPDGQPNLDDAIADLHAQGRGSAALGLQQKAITWTKSRAEAIKSQTEAMQTRYTTASQMAQGITDQASFNRIVPEIDKMLPGAAQLFGPAYDPKRIESIIDQGMTARDFLQKQKDHFDQGVKLIELNAKAVTDARSWENTKSELSSRWTNWISGQLSLSKSQEDWDHGLQIAEQGMTGLDKGFRESVINQFPKQFSRSAIEEARLLGMTQQQRSEEKSRDRTYSLEYLKYKDMLKGDVALSDRAKDGIAMALAKGAPMSNFPFGLGPQAVKDRTAIYNRAFEMFDNLDLAEKQAAYKANAQNLAWQTRTLSNITAYEGTALKNMDLFLEQGRKIIDTGSPLINAPFRKISSNVFGSGNQAAFNAARQVVTPEFARLIQSFGQSAGGILTNEAREEMDAVLSGDYTLKQLYDVASILRKDAFNRKSELQSEVEQIKKRIAVVPPLATPVGPENFRGTVPGGGPMLNAPGGGTLPIQPRQPTIGGGAGGGAGQSLVGQTMTVKDRNGKSIQVRITRVHPDGSIDGVDPNTGQPIKD